MKRLSTLMAILMLPLLAMANSILTLDLENSERRLFELELTSSSLTIQLEGLTLDETYGVVIGNRQGATCTNLVTLHHDQTLIASTANMGGFEAKTTEVTLTLSQDDLCNQQLYLSIYAKRTGNIPESSTQNVALIPYEQNITNEDVHEMLFNNNSNYAVSGTYTLGAPSSFGGFGNGSTSILMEEGLMVTTGSVMVALGPNDESDATLWPNFGGHYESDLSNLVGQPSYDAAALHFDITTSEDYLELEYVFASEEYCDWVGSQFDDVFGVFVSGPGINGSFENNAVLVSSPQNTNLPVSINNINYTFFQNLYISNVPPWQQQFSGGCTGDELNDPPAAPDGIEFDGFTVPMLAGINIIPGETYHVKVAIADMSDPLYDSGVFLQASPNVPVSVNYTVNYTHPNGATHIIRNCEASVGAFEVSRPASEEGTVVTVDVDYSGAGANHLDMSQMPSSITFEANELTKIIEIVFLPDNPQTGNTQLLLTINNAIQPQGVVEIKDLISEVIITSPECSDSVDGALEILTSIGISPYTYTLDGNPLASNIAEGLPGGTYILQTTDALGCEGTQTVEIIAPPVIVIESSDVSDNTCADANDGWIGLDISGGQGNLTVTWSNGAEGTHITDLAPGTYTATVMDALGCSITEDFVIAEGSDPTAFNEYISDVTCNGLANGTIAFEVMGGLAPYEYLWGDGTTGDSIRTDLIAGTYLVNIIDSNGCVTLDTFEIEEPDVLAIEQTDFVQNPCYSMGGGTLTLNGVGGTAPYTFFIDGNEIDPIIDNYGTGTVQVQAIDANDCEVTIEIALFEALTFEVVVSASAPGFCEGGAVELTAYMDNADSFIWNNDATATGNTYTATQAGMVSVTGTNIDGCEGTTSVDVIEFESPTTGSPTGETMVDIDNVYVYEVTSSLPNSTLEWSIEGGSILSYPTPNSVEVIWEELGTQSIEVTEISISGCAGATLLLEVEVSMDGFVSYNVNYQESNDISYIIRHCEETIGSLRFSRSAEGFGSEATLEVTYEGPGAVELDMEQMPSTITFGATELNKDIPIHLVEDNTMTDITYVNVELVGIDMQPGVFSIKEMFAFIDMTEPTCYDSSDGSVELNVPFGKVPIVHTLNGLQFTTGEINDLSAGNYDIVTEDALGCSVEQTITIGAPEALGLDMVGFEQYICYPDGAGATTFEVTGGVGPYTFFANDEEIAPIIENIGTGTLPFQVIDANGCIIEDELDLFEALEFEVTVEATPEPAFCEGDSILLTATMDNFESFVWNNDIITFGNALYISEVGIVEVIGINADGCEGTTEYEVYQFETPVTGVPTGVIESHWEGEAIYEVVTSIPNSTIEWTVEGGTILSYPTDNSVEVLWTEVGLQSITALEISDPGCLGQPETLEVQVDMIDNVNEITQNQGVQLYPNPFTKQTQLILDMPTLEAVKVELYNINGQLLQTYQTTSQSSLAVQRESLPSGTYVLVVSSESFRLHERVIVR